MKLFLSVATPAVALLAAPLVLRQDAAPALVDQADPSQTIAASSQPGVGDLAPLSETFFVDEAKGRVGIGKVSPDTKLHVYGNMRITWNGQVNEGIGSGSLQMSNIGYTRGWSGDPFGFQPYGGPLELDRLHTFGVDASDSLYVRPGGKVGIGVENPAMQLDVAGVVRTTDTIVSTKSAGAPFVIASDDVSANLNADLLDGRHADDFALKTDLDGLGGGALTGPIDGDDVVPDFGDQRISSTEGLSIGTSSAGAPLYVRTHNLGLISGSDEATARLEGREPRLVIHEDGTGAAGGISFERSQTQSGTAVPVSEVVDTWRLDRVVPDDGAGLRFEYQEAGSPSTPILELDPSGRASVSTELAVGGDNPLIVGDASVASFTDLTLSAGGALSLGAADEIDLFGSSFLATSQTSLGLTATSDLKLSTEGAARIEADSIRIESQDDLELKGRTKIARVGGTHTDTVLDLAGGENQRTKLMLTDLSEADANWEFVSYHNRGSGPGNELRLVHSNVNPVTKQSWSATGLTIEIEGWDEARVGVNQVNPTSALDVIGEVRATGNMYAPLFLPLSDERSKREVRDLEPAGAQLDRLRGVSFEWRDAGDDARRITGFLAQEVAEVLPDLVHEGPDGSLRLSYLELIPLLVEAGQDQRAEIAELEADVDALREGLAAALARIDALEAR